MQVRNLFLIFFVLLGVQTTSFAQDILEIHGSVRGKESSQKLAGTSVIITRDGVEFDNIVCNSSGRFSVDLPLGYRYSLKFTKKDYVHKILQFDSKNIPAEDMEGGFSYPLEVTLFKFIEGMDLTIFDEPIGKASFDSSLNAIEFDKQHTAIMKQKIQDELDRLADLDFNANKMQKDFDMLIERGDDKATKERYEDAISKYQQALKIFPDNEMAKKKIDDVQAIIDRLNASKADDAEYARYISDANSFMKKEEWEKAKSKYEKALTIKPDESEPKDKIREIDILLDNLMKRNEYNDLVDQGDRKMQSEDYSVAIKKFEEALAVLPKEEYPRSQIVIAQEKLDAILLAEADAEAMERIYREKMELADENFANKNFEIARDQYVQASDIKKDEERPKRQIEAIDALLDAIAQQENNAREREDEINAQKERDALYQKIVDEANTLYNDSALEEARVKYKLALTHKPNEQYPKSKIGDIDRMLEKIEENALRDQASDAAALEKQRKDAEYNAFIEEAESLLENDQWEASIGKYEDALGVKPGEKVPKSKISFIRKLIKDSKVKVSDNDHMAELERRRKAGELELERIRMESERKRENQLALLADQQQKHEDDAFKRRQEKADVNGRKGGLISEVDTSREREVDKFYKEAKTSTEVAKGKKVNAKREEHTQKISMQSNDAKRRRDDNVLDVNNKQDQMEQIYRDGEVARDLKVKKQEQLQESRKDNGDEEQDGSIRRRERTHDKIEDKRVENADRTNQTRNRQERITDREEQESDFKFKDDASARQGETGRIDNKNEVERKQEAVENAPNLGKEVRAVQYQKHTKKTEEFAEADYDTRAASKARQETTTLEIDNKKKVESTKNQDNIYLKVADNETEIKRKRENEYNSHQENRLAAKLRRLEALEKGKVKTEANPKTKEYSYAPKGSADIPEGITETSYKNGQNSDVIERTVKVGNRVDVYRKVIAKYGTAFFKNGSSITQQMWDQDTVKVTD